MLVLNLFKELVPKKQTAKSAFCAGLATLCQDVMPTSHIRQIDIQLCTLQFFPIRHNLNTVKSWSSQGGRACLIKGPYSTIPHKRSAMWWCRWGSHILIIKSDSIVVCLQHQQWHDLEHGLMPPQASHSFKTAKKNLKKIVATIDRTPGSLFNCKRVEFLVWFKGTAWMKGSSIRTILIIVNKTGSPALSHLKKPCLEQSMEVSEPLPACF